MMRHFSLSRLGNLYKSGAPGLFGRPAKAAGLFEQAVAKGDNAGREGLAQLQLDGAGMAKDADRAVSLLNDAINVKDTYAAVILANAYRTGAACRWTPIRRSRCCSHWQVQRTSAP